MSISELDQQGLRFEQEREYLRAQSAYQESRKQGSLFATNHLGMLYLSGYGVERDVYKAQNLFEECESKGDPHGMANLGTLLIQHASTVERGLHCLERSA